MGSTQNSRTQLSDTPSGDMDRRPPLHEMGCVNSLLSSALASGPLAELSRSSAGRESPARSCVWVDDEAAEHLAEALANWKAWKQRRGDRGMLTLPSSQLEQSEG